SDELQDMSLTPAQGFILSRIDGASRARDIIALSPLPDVEVAATLDDLVQKGLLAWGDEGGVSDVSGSDTATRRRGVTPKPGTLDDELEKELERILELASQKRYQELLGVSAEASTVEVKQSYSELIQRYHPDSQGKSLNAASSRKLSKACAAATEALSALSYRRKVLASKTARAARGGAAPKSEFDRSIYAEDLFKRAQRAYETADYWEAIQLARQAVELDPSKAPYHHLLGIGLMKNRNWLKEAEECLRKATELDPKNAEYFGLLATVYKAEGLPEDSASMLEKAKALDPTYC
ncbi:MAG TPA: DnaJ domain-containing protein, partial [Vicinamibacteria bacterium]